MSHSPLVFTFGILGNIASFVCFLAPLPTFYRVCKKKSTEGFQSIPYVAALFSAMLWIFYAYVKTGETLLITINAFGCVIETIYLAIYITYCPKKVRMSTLRMILLLNFGGFCSIVLLTRVLAKGANRLKLLGWICVVFATSVFAAPLSIIRVVIRTKSVEFLPFPLSLLLFISAVMWLMYGISLKDIYVTLPNVVGLAFGTVQMVLYAMYRNNKPVQDQKLPEHKGDIIENNNNEIVEKHEQDQKLPEQEGDIPISISSLPSSLHSSSLQFQSLHLSLVHEEVRDIGIGIGEKKNVEKKEEKEKKEEEEVQKKQDHEQNQTELNKDKNNNKKDLTRESCEV